MVSHATVFLVWVGGVSKNYLVFTVRIWKPARLSKREYGFSICTSLMESAFDMSDLCTRGLSPSQLEFLGHYEASPGFFISRRCPRQARAFDNNLGWSSTHRRAFSEFVIGLVTGYLTAGCFNRAVTHCEAESSDDVFGGRSLRGLFP